MYIPPIILVSLLQVTGPTGGEQVDALHVPAPITLVARTEVADTVPVVPPERHLAAKRQAPPENLPENAASAEPAPAQPKQEVFNTNDLYRRAMDRNAAPAASGTPNLDSYAPTETSTGAGVPYSGASMDAYPTKNLQTSERVSDTLELIRRAIVETEDGGDLVLSAGTPGRLAELRVPQVDPRTGVEIPGPDGKPIMVKVKAGQLVREGQVLGKTEDDTEAARVASAKAMLDVAKAEAKKTIEIEFAVASHMVAHAEVLKNKFMNEKNPNTVPHMLVLEAQLRETQAAKQWEKAKYELEVIKAAEVKVKEQELHVAETLLAQRKIISPINGRVVDVRASEGEWFREGDKLLRIIRLDKLRIRGRVDGTRLTPKAVDRKFVKVTLDNEGKPVLDAQGRPLEFNGKVVFVNEEFEFDQHFYIHVEVENRKDEQGYWLLNPGRFVNLLIHLE